MTSTPILIWKKEIRGMLYTWKGTLWLVISSLMFSFSSYLLLTDKELSLLDQTELMWILGKVIISIGFLMVAIDASSSLTSEIEQETAEQLFVVPIRPMDFIVGKFLSSLSLWGAIYIVAIPYVVAASSGTNLVWPFLLSLLGLGTLGIIGLIALIFSIGLLYRSSKNTLTTSLIIILGMGIPSLFSATLLNNPLGNVLGTIDPINAIFSSLDNVLVDYHFSPLENMAYIGPLIGFLFLMLIFLFVVTRRFTQQGVVGQDQ